MHCHRQSKERYGNRGGGGNGHVTAQDSLQRWTVPDSVYEKLRTALGRKGSAEEVSEGWSRGYGIARAVQGWRSRVGPESELIGTRISSGWGKPVQLHGQAFEFKGQRLLNTW